MILTQLVPEIVGQILAHCTGQELGLLYLCGNHNLLRLINHRHGAKSFFWTADVPLHEIPQIISRLPQLRSLRLDSRTNPLLSGRTRQAVIFPPSLEILELNFQGSVIYFYETSFPPPKATPSPQPWLDFSNMLPNLQHLRFHSNSLEIMNYLPNSLIHLAIFSNNDAPSAAYGNLARLPLSLEYLFVQLPLAAPPETLDWPPNLHTLLLPGSSWRRLPTDFPASITKLQLAYPSKPFNVAEEVVKARHLKALRLSYQVAQDLEMLPYLQLETLHVDSEWLLAFSSWPVTLTSLTVRTVDRENMDSFLKDLPRTLTHLSAYVIAMDIAHLRVTRYTLKNLPDLVTLQIRGGAYFSPKDFSLLPRSLTDCPCVSSDLVQGADLQDLPKGLRSISFLPRKKQCSIDGNHLARAPTSLTSLNIEVDTGSLNDLALRYLPRTLVHFIHRRKHDIDGSGFDGFPATLRTLIIPLCNSAGDKSIAKLPPQLAVLEIGGDPQLLTAKAFSLVPRALRTLTFMNMAQVPSNAAFGELPRGIAELALPGLGSITDQVFAHLPPDLRSLMFKGNKSLTPKCLAIVRPSLVELKLPSNNNFAKVSTHRVFRPSSPFTAANEYQW